MVNNEIDRTSDHSVESSVTDSGRGPSDEGGEASHSRLHTRSAAGLSGSSGGVASERNIPPPPPPPRGHYWLQQLQPRALPNLTRPSVKFHGLGSTSEENHVDYVAPNQIFGTDPTVGSSAQGHANARGILATRTTGNKNDTVALRCQNKLIHNHAAKITSEGVNHNPHHRNINGDLLKIPQPSPDVSNHTKVSPGQSQSRVNTTSPRGCIKGNRLSPRNNDSSGTEVLWTRDRCLTNHRSRSASPNQHSFGLPTIQQNGISVGNCKTDYATLTLNEVTV